jgi:hypothetical protein
MDTRRRELGKAIAENLLGAAGEAGTTAAGKAGPMGLAPSIRDSLAGLKIAEAELGNTWHPEDTAYRADLYRQITMNLAFGYFVYFAADAEHPDWSPLYNPVFACQPNPDDIYLFSPLRSDLTYRVSGNRGTVSKLIFVTQKGIPGTQARAEDYTAVNSLDEQDFKVGSDGEFEIIFSARRPDGYTGNWSELKPGADVIFSRYRMIDWINERDPQMSIECLDPVPPKRRLTPEQIADRIALMAAVPANQNKIFYRMQNDIKEKVGYNVIDPIRIPGLTKQLYWPAVFQLKDDEALIIETPMPHKRPYWNIQLNDPLFNAVEYVYRISSINESTAWIAPDGKLRAVIAMKDPGVANWLDPFGYNEGTLYGRWYDCDSMPIPTIKRVPLAELRTHLPSETPEVTPAQRSEQLRARVRACQRRRRW